MQLIKITQLNEDGSIAFEGFFPPEEARMVLEVGINLLLTQGLLAPGLDGEDEEDEELDEDDFEVEGPDTLQ